LILIAFSCSFSSSLFILVLSLQPNSYQNTPVNDKIGQEVDKNSSRDIIRENIQLMSHRTMHKLIYETGNWSNEAFSACSDTNSVVPIGSLEVKVKG